MGTRFLLAGLLLLAWARWRGQRMPSRTQWRNATIIGVLMLGSSAGVAFAEQSVGSGLVVAFIAVTPALITLASLPFGRRPAALEVIGIGMGIIGVMLLIRGTGFSSSPSGLIAITTAALGWSIGSVLSQHVYPLAPAASGFASEMICGGLFLLGLSLCTSERMHWPPQPLALAAWMYLVFFGSLLAFTAYMVLLAKTTMAVAASYSFINPIIGMLLGVSLAGERVTRLEWLAVVIIVVGVCVIVTGRGLHRVHRRSI